MKCLQQVLAEILFVEAYVCMYRCIHGPKIDIRCLPWLIIPLSAKTGSLAAPDFLILVVWPASLLCRFRVLCFPNSEVTGSCYFFFDV